MTLKKVHTTTKLIKANSGYFLAIPKHMMDFMELELHQTLNIVYNATTKQLVVTK